MKILITLKDPDTLYEAVKDAVVKDLKNSGFPEDEIEVLTEKRIEKIMSFADRWFEYREYVTLEMDTEKQTCVVLGRD